MITINVICKKHLDSIVATLYKNHKYECEYNENVIIVYDELNNKLYFRKTEFNEYFYTEKELRLKKIQKLNNE